MDVKGQVSVEFIIVLVLLLSLFLFSLAVFAERNSGYALSREIHEARLLADKIARTVNKVHLAGEGAEAIVLVDKRADFNVSVSGNSLVLEWRNNYLDSALLTDNVEIKSLTQGGFVKVKNVDGGVEIENA